MGRQTYKRVNKETENDGILLVESSSTTTSTVMLKDDDEVDGIMRRQEIENDSDTTNKTENHVPLHIRKAKRLICISHAVSQFSEAAWYFAVVLFLSAISHYKSILLVSTYYLSTYITIMIAGAPFGSFLDRSNRLFSAKFCIGAENVSVLLATVACCWLLTDQQHQQEREEEEQNDRDNVIPTDTRSILLIVAIHVFGSLAQLLNQGFVVAIERDWIVVLSHDTTHPHWLNDTNVKLRQIYLTCKVLSPTFAGWIVGQASPNPDHYCDLHGAAILVGVLCVTSLVVEYVCTVRVYHLVPALAVTSSNTSTVSDKHDSLESDDDTTPPATNDSTKACSVSFGIYWQQSIVLAGLALAFMNSNALCFGGPMTTYLLFLGMPVQQVGLWRGVGSAVGLLGTFAYQWSVQRTSIPHTGMWSIIYLFVCLTVACSSFFFLSSPGDDDDDQGKNYAMYLLVVGTALSRIGLWVFDISVTMLYQESVPNGVRSLIGGTQQSLNSFFTMGSACMGLFFRKPEEFYVMAVVGYVCIAIATVLYSVMMMTKFTGKKATYQVPPNPNG